jgi:alkanesulfonate monooxygenase SsuD/methylene tetrahydromethanopterin reductase-like flavin-dependent oxidoreductase (luciferase family)
VGRHFDGWIPNDADPVHWEQHWTKARATARESGRDPDRLTGAMYLTAAVDDDSGRANERLDAYLEQYYGQRPAGVRARQICYAGSATGLAELMKGYTKAGVNHLVLRFAGHHERHLGLLAGLRAALGS